MKTTIVWVVLAIVVAVVEGTPPTFENSLPIDIYVGENENRNRLLYTLTVSDPNGDAVVCTNSISSVGNNHNDDEFTFIRNPVTQKYELDVAPPAVGFAAGETYQCTISCNDGVQTSTGIINVHVVNGQDVWWNTIPSTVPRDAKSTPAGTTIDTAQASNTLGKTMSYYLSSVNPSSVASFFQVTKSTGDIITTDHLKYIAKQDATEIAIAVTATDGEINITETVTLQLSNQNWKPTTRTLPLKHTKLESVAAGTVLFQLTAEDNNPGDTSHTVSWNCTPTSSESIFTLDSNNRFKIATDKNLDYETANFINCTFFINDGLHDSDPYVYELTVADANDAPVFDTSITYKGTMYEGASGSSSTDPGFVCTDEDSNNGPEPLTYSFQNVNNSQRFSIDSDGIITFNGEYDVDSSNMPTTVVLTVYCVDDGDAAGKNKLTSSAQVTLTIVDANDNAPDVPNTATMYSDNTMTPGSSVIGSLNPTDADSGSNGEVTCSATSSDGFASYYAVTSSCDIILAKAIDFDPGETVQYLVYATDKGDPQLTSTSTVDVIYREVDTTTTTTTSATTTATTQKTSPCSSCRYWRV